MFAIKNTHTHTHVQNMNEELFIWNEAMKEIGEKKRRREWVKERKREQLAEWKWFA